MPVTTPDSIYFSDVTATMDPNAISAAQATSVQAALAKRGRYSYTWADSAARTAQTGMAPGSQGYQIDTKTEYIYENSAWRVAVSYAEFTGSNTMGANVYSAPSTMTLSSSASTDLTFASMAGTGSGAGSTGYLILTNPGIYSLSWTTVISANVSALAQFSPSTITSNPYAIVTSVTNASTTNLSVPMPFLRTTTANQRVYLYYFQNSGSSLTVTDTVRVGRLA